MSEAESRDGAKCRPHEAQRSGLRLLSVGVGLLFTGCLDCGVALALSASQWPGVVLVTLGAVVVALCHYEGSKWRNASSEIDAVNVRMNRIHDDVAAVKSRQDDMDLRLSSLSLSRM